MKRIIFISLGSLSFVLGIVGIFLPVLPTTPFLLLTAWCYANSSQRLYQWLITHPVFGAYILQFREDRSIPMRVKIVAISTLWVFLLVSILWVVRAYWYVQLLLLMIGVGVTAYLLSLKTRKP